MLKKHCANMNHGKMNPPIKFCPNCGELLNSGIRVSCDDAKHKHFMKSRNFFCCDCGKKLLDK
jgi:acetone carboxylase gamma subunit